MDELAALARSPGKIYFTGGATALLLGFREQTIDRFGGEGAVFPL